MTLMAGAGGGAAAAADVDRGRGRGSEGGPGAVREPGGPDCQWRVPQWQSGKSSAQRKAVTPMSVWDDVAVTS